MPRPKRTEEEITAMRERILDAAVAILHAEGPAGLSIRAIAERVGVSHMVLYSYFDNRAELFASLRQRQRQRMQARHVETMARAAKGDVRAVLREVLEGYVTFAHNNPHIFCFLWSVSPGHFPGAQGRCGGPPPPHEGHRQEIRHLTDLIRLGIERGKLARRDPFIAALMVAGMINGPLIMYLLPGRIDDQTLERLTAEAVEASMNYLTGQESQI